MVSQTTWLHSQIAPLTLMETRLSVLDMVISKTSRHTSSTYTLVCCCTCCTLHGQTPFHTEGKRLGHGHRRVCHPAPWSAYQSLWNIPSNIWLMRKFKISVWIGEWTEQEVFESWAATKFKITSASRSQVLLWWLLSPMSWLDYLTN